MPTSYAPLHVHSQFSLLEASSKIKDLVKIAKANAMPALALTDSGNLYGAVEFYSACKAEGIKPIIGCELGLVEGAIDDRNSRQPVNTLVLLAKNWNGYKNLIKLVSIGHLQGFYYRPRINWDLLEQYSSDLVVLTDCLSGPIGYNVLRGHMDVAREKVSWLKRVFGENLYIELQDHGQAAELQVTAEAVKIAKEFNLPLVITNNSRFSYPGQETVLDILLCMQSGKTLNDPSRTKRFGPDYYLKSADEMLQRFHHLDRQLVEEALANTLKVAEKIDFSWPMGESILPQFPLPDGQTEAGYLREVVIEFARKKYGATLPEPVEDRLDTELTIINDMGFPAYFLIVWDFINWAREQDIPVGPGRGSAAGSLVAYVLGITNIDPLEHNLLFERFLNPERVSMPDIDIDFCIERRGDVIDYVAKRYGRERVCQIATFGTLAAKAAVKAVARVLDIPYAESDRISKMIPGTPGIKLKDAMGEGSELAAEYESRAEIKEWIDLALELEGTACNVGTHAAGVVISKDPLDEVIALQHSKDGQVISQFTMGDLEKLGLLKMDFLGLRNLTIINNALRLIKTTHGEEKLPDMDHLPLEDETVYAMLSRGETDGVFQLESSGMKALVKDLKPSQFEDMNALVALYRPGPLNSGMVKTFVDRKHGRQEVSFPHPDLEPILKDTYGTIVYQEQIMQIAQILARYSLGRADLLRRAMGKKKAEVMEKEREGFLEGAIANDVDKDLADGLFDVMSEFAAYCFNRSHSAAYAYVAFQTAYLKAHFPVEYLSALLSSVRDSLDKIRDYIVTARGMGITVLPPSVNESSLDFTPSGNSILFGLASVKNVGTGVVEAIVEARQEKAFASLGDFLERVSPKVLNRKTLESLIQCGALDCFGKKRKYLMDNIEALSRYAAERQEASVTGQVSLFAAMAQSNGESFGGLLLSGKAEEEYTPAEIQAMEKALLGFYISSHPLDGLEKRMPLLCTHTVAELKDLEDGTDVIIGGLVDSVTRRISRKNTPFLLGTIEDFTGECEFMVFREAVDTLAPVFEHSKTLLLRARVSIRSGDEEGENRFSLIVDEAQPVESLQPIVLRFNEAPSYELLAYLAGLLSDDNGDATSLDKKQGARSGKNGFRRKPASTIRLDRSPVILRLNDDSEWRLPHSFWISSNELENKLVSLKRFANYELMLN